MWTALYLIWVGGLLFTVPFVFGLVQILRGVPKMANGWACPMGALGLIFLIIGKALLP